MNKTIKLLINLILQLSIISWIIVQNAHCNLDRNNLAKKDFAKDNFINHKLNRNFFKNGLNDVTKNNLKRKLLKDGLDKIDLDQKELNNLDKKNENQNNLDKKNGDQNSKDQNNLENEDQESFNHLIHLRLESINNYFQLNLFDLNTKLNDYLNRLNDYLLSYTSLDQPEIEKIQMNICLANRSDVCWDIEDSIDIIGLNRDVDNSVIGPLRWLTKEYNLSNTLTNLNFSSLNLSSLNFSQLTLNKFNLNNLNTLNIDGAFFISFFNKFDNEELKSILICFNLFMPFVCGAFLFLLCIQNQHRRKIIELNQLFRKIECVSGLRQLKEDMKTLAKVIDELKFDSKQNQELKFKLQQILSNEISLKQLDLNGNQIQPSNKGDKDLTTTFSEQIICINQQLKLNQLEQSKLKYMVCKTIESFDRILNKMKNNCELINS